MSDPNHQNPAGASVAPGASPETPATSAGQAGAAAPPADLQARLLEAQAKAEANYDLYMRSQAEMQNVRKRAQEDVAKAHKYSIESFAQDLVPVKDSLEMALKTDTPSIEGLREGVEATLAQIKSVFDKNKLLEIDPAGQKFDPTRHQAISMVPVAATNPPVAANHVVMVLQKGYLINDRVLRPALVTVAQG